VGGGKRIRPSLLLLAARCLGYTGSGDRFGWATVVELVHTATLVHDDIIDGADMPPRTTLGQHHLGQQKNVCWPATGFTCRRFTLRLRNGISRCSTC